MIGDFEVEFFLTILVVFTLVFVVTALAILGITHYIAIGEVVEYKELCKIVNDLEDDSSKTYMVKRTVADWNIKIQNARAYNEIPIIEWWIPDRIAELEPINLEARK